MHILSEGFLLQYKHAYTWKQNIMNKKQQKQYMAESELKEQILKYKISCTICLKKKLKNINKRHRFEKNLI